MLKPANRPKTAASTEVMRNCHFGISATDTKDRYAAMCVVARASCTVMRLNDLTALLGSFDMSVGVAENQVQSTGIQNTIMIYYVYYVCVLYDVCDVSDLTGGFYGGTGFERSQAHF